MKSHWEIFQEAYQKATPEMRNFIDKNYIREFITSFQKNSDYSRDLVFGCNLKICNTFSDEEILEYFNNASTNRDEILTIIKAGTSLFISEIDYNKLSHSNITLQNRQSALSRDPEKLEFFTSNSARVQMLNIYLKHSLPLNFEFKKYLILTEDIILGFYKIEDTIALLQQELEIDEATATQLGGEVLEYLQPLSDPNWQPPLDEDSEITSGADKSVSAVSTNSVLVVENSVSVHEPLAIPEIRTMAGDMAHERIPDRSTFNAAADFEEPAYVSTQPEIEKKGVEVPSYATSTAQSSNPTPTTNDSRWN